MQKKLVRLKFFLKKNYDYFLISKNIIMKKKLVSILISNYNKENYIKRCLNSCVNQNYKNIEIIFVDNLSNDNSLKIAKDFKNIKVLSTKTRSKYPALNQIDTLLTGLKFCKGKIISLLDSDDFLKKNKITKIVEYFSKYPNKNLVCDTPYLYYHKNYIKKFVNKKKRNFYVWPTIFPTSSINLRKIFLVECLNNIFPKMFPQIEIDFRILVFADKIKNDLNILGNNLTYYFQNPKGILSVYKKFSFYWWNKRFEAHKFMEFFYKKNNIKFIKTLDYRITCLMSLLSMLYFRINPLKLNSLHFTK
jgi:glycosyltransferase involved in cell wall biosynthesis